MIDDGVVARLADGRFYVTTTTSGSTAIYRELQRRVAEWQLDCTLHNLTGHLAAMNIAGPHARRILAQCTRWRWMTSPSRISQCARARVAGVDGAPARVGFVGELGFEIHVPFDQAQAVWDALVLAGQAPACGPSASKPSASCGWRRGTSSSVRIPTASPTPLKPASRACCA